MWVVGCRTPSCLGRIESFNSIFVSRGTAVKKWNDRPTGKWVEADLDNSFKTCNKCHCGMMAYDAEKLGFRFCPWCGVEMENGA